MGILGGVLIAVAAILTGSGFNFSTDTLKNTTLLILFLAGIAVVIFLLMGNRTYAGYSAIAATTIALIAVVDMIRGPGLDLTVRLVVLVVGVILALIGSVGSKK
jgi:hypothetical protein